MPGYHNKPEETAKALRNGWYHTGDLAKSDANGFLTITGRLKELIIRGGQNIAPAEIEEVVNTFPPVLDCAVVGVPHEHARRGAGAVRGRAPRQDDRDRRAARALPRAALGLQGSPRRASDRGDPAHRIGQDHPLQAAGDAGLNVRSRHQLSGERRARSGCARDRRWRAAADISGMVPAHLRPWSRASMRSG